jgi:cellobiose transport system substrate-binding protein
MGGHRRLRAGWALLAALMLAGLAACGGSSNSGGGGSGGTITLTVNTFGNFGFTDLYKKYEAAHPNIKIRERVAEYNAHHEQLATHLATGSGAGDIEGVDEGFIVQFKAQPQNFVNLLDMGADSIKDRWLPWKWNLSLSADGKTQIGLGTDVGGLAMCYRRDLFEKAGLPADRDAVSKLWPDWQGYIAAGEKFQAAGTGVSFMDAGTNMYNGIVNQLPTAYYDTSDQLLVSTNPGIKQAWDLTMQAVAAKESAGLQSFSPQWNAGFVKGSFATVTCPAWMRGYIEQQAPKTSGLWDVATVPGNTGNWGGSYLAIPKQTKHPKEAYDLAAFLTSPESQLEIWTKTGNFPSQPALYTNPAVTGLKPAFFNRAPMGELFSKAAVNLKPVYQGPKTGPVRQAMENAIRRVEAGRQSPDEAWRQGVADAEKAAG